MESADLERISSTLSPKERKLFDLLFSLNGQTRPRAPKMLPDVLNIDKAKAGTLQAELYKKIRDAGFMVLQPHKKADEWPRFIKVTKVG